jgi:outer membrane protein
MEVKDASPPAQITEVITGEAAILLALEVMLQAGDQEGALTLLRATPTLHERPDGQRLQAQLLLALGRSDEALSVLERLLAKTPKDGLARFQVGEAHYQARRQRPAELAYRLALASDLDSARSSLARQRLKTLSAQRGWQGSLSILIAPDSNLNSATQSRSVEIFGLPFELDANARSRSGVSSAVQGQIGRSFHLSGPLHLSGQVAALVGDAPGRSFDDAWAQVRLGPELRLPQEGRFSAQFTHASRWFGGDLFEVSNGVRLDASLALDTTARFDVTARAESVDNKINLFRSGELYVLDVGRTKFGTASTLSRWGITLVRRDAQAPSEAFDSATIAIGYLLPAPWATSLYLEPYASGRWFDGASFAFGVRRQDLETGIAARLTKRSLVVKGWSPFVAATLSSSQSNLEIARFSRQRVEFGFTQTY